MQSLSDTPPNREHAPQQEQVPCPSNTNIEHLLRKFRGPICVLLGAAGAGICAEISLRHLEETNGLEWKYRIAIIEGTIFMLRSMLYKIVQSSWLPKASSHTQLKYDIANSALLGYGGMCTLSAIVGQGDAVSAIISGAHTALSVLLIEFLKRTDHLWRAEQMDANLQAFMQQQAKRRAAGKE